MPLDAKLPDRLLDTYLTCLRSKDVLYYPSEVTREDNALGVSELAMRQAQHFASAEAEKDASNRQKFDCASHLAANLVLRLLS